LKHLCLATVSNLAAAAVLLQVLNEVLFSDEASM
jgi:hypothetical protein